MRHFTLLLISIFTLLNSLNAQWESLGAGTTTTPRLYFALDVVDAQTIWGVTIHPSLPTGTDEVVKSMDGGQTWEVSNLPSTTGTYYTLDVQAIDENTAWVLMVNLPEQDRAKIFKTSDGGLNWTEQTGEFNDAGHAFASMHFFNENEGLCFGSPGTGDANIDSIQIFKTIDSGSTWDRIPTSELPELLPGEGNWLYAGNGGYEVKGDTLWFVSRKSRVFRTIDKGATWEAFDTGINAAQGLSAIAFEDEQNGIAIGIQPNRAVRTEDGGETWTEIAIPSSPQAGLIEYIPDTEDTYVISPGSFLGGSRMAISRDGGTSWANPSFPTAVKCLQFISPTLGFAGGTVSTTQNKGLFKWTGDLSDPLYVDHAATGAGNGTSWTHAFVDVQSALDAAETNDQIWVAQGTYNPSSPSMIPAETYFEDVVGVKLYGGFEGVEIYIGDRDPEENLTILSADLMGDDLPNNFEDNRSDNAYHVLTSIHSNNSVLDGFTISGGHALLGDGGGLDYVGGGVVSTSDLVVNNCIFMHNQAAQGGAMSGQNDAFTVTNSLFIENKSTYGGLLILLGTDEPFLISGNRFEGNTASDFGGAMTVGNCEAIIENNEFEGNSSEFTGAGVMVYQNDFAPGGKAVSLINNQFLNNSAAFRGGAITCNNFNHASVFNITDCHFEGNTAGHRGGAVKLLNTAGLNGTAESYSSNFFLEENTFINNEAPYGGGMYLSNGADEMNVSILSSIFENNTATDNGGAMTAEVDDMIGMNLQMENLQVIGNSATEKGGGLYLDVGLPCQLLNSVINENSANEGAAFYLQSSSEMNAENILIAENTGSWAIHNNDALHLVGVTCAGNDIGLYQQGAATTSFQNTIMANDDNYLGVTENYTSNGGNLSSDATLSAAFIGSDGFLDLNETDPGLDQDFIPTASSPCIDAGNPNAITSEEDLAGNARIQGTEIDMGAYETPFVTPIEDLANFINMEVFPNPFVDEIHITSEKPVLSLELLDIKGKVIVKSLNSSALQGLEFLPAGVYLLEIRATNGVQNVKIIKS